MNIVLQVGQCGNQLGSNFFSTLAEVLNQKRLPINFVEGARERFFSNDNDQEALCPRTVLVDTEPKVINQTLLCARKQSLSYGKDCSYIQKQGSGNNWAMGYFEHGVLAKEPVMNLVRRECERCDHLEGFHLFMSVAGGTGSGLGSLLTETLKDEYPRVPIMNEIVCPLQRGEVTVQAHNAMLTLTHLQDASDAILVFENDLLYNICMERLRMKDVSLSDMNTVASTQLACLLLPSKSSSSGFTCLFGDILSQMVAHPQYKLLNLRSVPQEPPECRPYSSYSWQSLLRILRRMVLYSSVVEEWAPNFKDSASGFQDTCVSIANMLILRGLEADSVDTKAMHSPALPYASWVPEGYRNKTCHSSVQLFEQQKTATLAHNGQSVIPCIDALVAKSWKMYNYKVYLHHYSACGLEEPDFMDHFAQAEQLVASYKSLKWF